MNVHTPYRSMLGMICHHVFAKRGGKSSGNDHRGVEHRDLYHRSQISVSFFKKKNESGRARLAGYAYSPESLKLPTASAKTKSKALIESSYITESSSGALQEHYL